jgi:hypothetical protein
MTVKTLREQIELKVRIGEISGLSSSETAASILSLVLAKVKESALTESEIEQVKKDYLDGKFPKLQHPIKPRHLLDFMVAAAQLEAIKKVLK